MDGSFEFFTKIDIEYDDVDIAMSDKVVVIGSPRENDSTGAIYIYEKDDNRIRKETMKIVPSDIRQGASFGFSVAIDGNVIAVGADGSVYPSFFFASQLRRSQ
mmetsp:Transcript_26118/g.55099  ORF Transcript_26118/g.55099 Transcript_26118/m.55099 type:complete len:103 (-) Transcript_26118:73-381(-)